jgi:hypothetical protein
VKERVMSDIVSWERVFLGYFSYGEEGINNATYILNYPEVKQVRRDSEDDHRLIEGFCAAVCSTLVSNDLVMLILADLYARIQSDGYERLAFVFMKLLYPCWHEHRAMLLGMLTEMKRGTTPKVSQIVTRELDAYKNNKDLPVEFLEFLDKYGF